MSKRLEEVLINFEKYYYKVKPILNLMGFELKKEEDKINLYSLNGEFISEFLIESAEKIGEIYFREDSRQLSYKIYSIPEHLFLTNEIHFSDYISGIGFLHICITFFESKEDNTFSITINNPYLECEDIKMIITNDKALNIQVDKTDSLKAMRILHYLDLGHSDFGNCIMALEKLNPGKFVHLQKHGPYFYTLTAGKLENQFFDGEPVKKYSKEFHSKEDVELFMKKFMSSERIKNLYEYVMNSTEATIPGITDYIFSNYEVLGIVKNKVESEEEKEMDPEMEALLKYFRIKTLDFKTERNVRGLRK